MKKLALRIAKYYWIFVSSILSRNRRPQSIEKRVLITKFDGLGDFFLLIPFLQNLITNGYEIVCISPPSFSEITTHLKIALTFIPFTNKNVRSFKKLIDYVKEQHFCLAVNLSMNVWGGILVNQSCAKLKVGLLQEREHYVYKGSKLFYDKILNYAPATHNFEVLQNVFNYGLKLPPIAPQIKYPDQNYKYNKRNPLIIHPYASWIPRRWPHFAILIAELIKKGYTIKLLGTRQEHQTCSWLSEFIETPQLSIVNLSSIDHLMTEIENCSALIGNDSGPAHYAALIGKPTTVIWGPGFFERIHPVGKNVTFNVLPARCRPCRQKGITCVNGKNSCLIDISVEMVLEHFEKTLKIDNLSEKTNV